MSSKLLGFSAALALVFAVGCGPSQAPEAQEPQQVQESAGCSKGQYLCTSCDGLSTYCGDACLDCTPPAAPGGEVEAMACPSGKIECPQCDGTGTYCATRCFECADPGLQTGGDVEAAATCKTGERLCPKCDGSGSYCAIRCFECAPL